MVQAGELCVGGGAYPHEAAARSPELVEPSIIATTESSSVISPSVHLVAILSLSSKLAPFPLPV